MRDLLTPYRSDVPLAIYVFSSSGANTDFSAYHRFSRPGRPLTRLSVLKNTRSGGAVRNDVMMQFASAYLCARL
jgi:hypothetical protein